MSLTNIEVKDAINFGLIRANVFTHHIATERSGSEYAHLKCQLDVVTYNEHTDKDETLGTVMFNVVNVFANGDIPAVIRAVNNDEESTTEDGILWTRFYQAIDEKLQDCDFVDTVLEGKVATVDRFEVKENYRGLGVGKVLMEELKDYLSFFPTDAIILIPAPLETFENELSKEQAQQNLNKFYSKLGFTVCRVRNAGDLGYVAYTLLDM